jgi:hypothetical protein
VKDLRPDYIVYTSSILYVTENAVKLRREVSSTSIGKI